MIKGQGHIIYWQDHVHARKYAGKNHGLAMARFTVLVDCPACLCTCSLNVRDACGQHSQAFAGRAASPELRLVSDMRERGMLNTRIIKFKPGFFHPTWPIANVTSMLPFGAWRSAGPIAAGALDAFPRILIAFVFCILMLFKGYRPAADRMRDVYKPA